MTNNPLPSGVEREANGWLPVVLCPTDGVDRALLLPDGREVVGAFHNGLGRRAGWRTASPMEVERPVYEYPSRGGFIAPADEYKSRPEPERKQTGTRKDIVWVIGNLPEGVYPTHFRPNDTVFGPAKAALLTALDTPND